MHGFAIFIRSINYKKTLKTLDKNVAKTLKNIGTKRAIAVDTNFIVVQMNIRVPPYTNNLNKCPR
jgi:hypothetical protein